MMLLFLFMLSAYGFGAVGALALSGLALGRGALGRAVAAVGAGGGAVAGLALGGSTLVAGQTFSIAIPRITPLTGFALQLDGLGEEARSRPVEICSTR